MALEMKEKEWLCIYPRHYVFNERKELLRVPPCPTCGRFEHVKYQGEPMGHRIWHCDACGGYNFECEIV